MRPTPAPGLLLLLALAGGCRPASHATPRPPPVPDEPAPGVAMGCGIRGRLIDGFGDPRVFVRVAAVSLDQSARVVATSDSDGRFALPTECRRPLMVGGRTRTGIALAAVWVADEAVDIELRLPDAGDELSVRGETVAAALRQRVLELVPPTLTRPAALDEDGCAARANELRRIRSDPQDAPARRLAGVALMATACAPCPGDETSVAMIGGLIEDRGVAEAWPFGYGRLFACRPGDHPFEAKFARVLDELDPELAARVVFGRYVEADAQHDWTSADRLAHLLDDGPLADTEFMSSMTSDRGLAEP